KEQIHVIHRYSANLPQPGSFVIKIAGVTPRPDLGIDDLIDLIADYPGEEFVIAGFLERSADRYEEFGFLGFCQAEIIGQKVRADVAGHLLVTRDTLIVRFLARLDQTPEKVPPCYRHPNSII